MKLLKHFQLALVLLLITDAATFDYVRCKSKKLTEGTCPKKKCILLKCASGTNEPSFCEKSNCPIRLASCNVKEKPCSSCSKEKSSCQQKESVTECPFCGQEICPQQPKPNCPPPKPTGCPGQQPSCPAQKEKTQSRPSCPGQKQNCPQSKPKCPQTQPKTKCPQQQKPSCPSEKPACPERCSVFSKFPFATVMNTKKAEPPKIEHKGKCGRNCPGGDACKGKPIK